MTTTHLTPDLIKARLFLALVMGAGLWGLGAFLQERAVFESFVLVVLAAASFVMQTGGRGFPMRTPTALTELVAEVKAALGGFGAYVSSGSKLWTLAQAVAFGFAALLLRFVATAILPASAPVWVAPVLALSVLGFGFALAARHFAATNPVADRFRGVGEAVRKLIPLTVTMPPTVMLAVTAVVRAGAVELAKWGVLSISGVLFHPLFGVFLAAVIVVVIAAPELVKGGLGKLRSHNNSKEDAESSAD